MSSAGDAFAHIATGSCVAVIGRLCLMKPYTPYRHLHQKKHPSCICYQGLGQDLRHGNEETVYISTRPADAKYSSALAGDDSENTHHALNIRIISKVTGSKNRDKFDVTNAINLSSVPGEHCFISGDSDLCWLLPGSISLKLLSSRLPKNNYI